MCCKGASIKDVRQTGGGGEANADACVNFAYIRSDFTDAEGGGQKTTKFCGRPLWMPPNSEPNSVSPIYLALEITPSVNLKIISLNVQLIRIALLF